MAEPKTEACVVDHPLIQQLKEKGYYNKSFNIVFTVTVKLGKEAEMIEGIHKVVPPTLKTDGCILYDFHQDIKDSTHFVLYEKWRDGAALNEHINHQHTKDFLALMQVVASAADLRIVAPISVE